MSIEYRVFDPMTGEHVKANSCAQAQVALERAAQRLIEAMNFSVCEVEIDDVTGDETWRRFESVGAVCAATGGTRIQDRIADIVIENPNGPPP